MARTADSSAVIDSKRAAIIDAAESILATTGKIESISFRELAKILKCSYATPYRYFSNRQELLMALKARAFRLMESELKQSFCATDSVAHQLRAIANTYIRTAISRPEFYALMFFEIDGNTHSKSSNDFLAAKHDCLDVCTQAVLRGQASGQSNSDLDALTLSHMFWAGAHGLVSLHISGQLVMGKSLDDLIPVMIATLNLGARRASKSNISNLKVIQK